MKIVTLYDIHGNLPALEAVLETVKEIAPDLVIVGGDVVPGPMSEACMNRLADMPWETKCLLGNTDREVLSRIDGIETEWYRHAPPVWRRPLDWVSQHLSTGSIEWLRQWPSEQIVSHPSLGNICFCHAVPGNDTTIVTEESDNETFIKHFGNRDQSLFIFGHTHMQFERQVRSLRLVNSGSVGMAFGRPLADWSLIDNSIRLQSTEYDLERARIEFEKTDFPGSRDVATNMILNPLSKESMLKAYAESESLDVESEFD